MKIITNNHTYELKTKGELPPKVQEEFDYVTGEDEFRPRFAKYRDEWYDVNDFVTTCPGPFNHGIPKDFEKWDGYIDDSFFSGVLVKFVEDFEHVKFARYIND